MHFSNRGQVRAVVTTVLVATSVSVAQAHEFWLEPSSHRPAAGESVSVTLRVGERFQGEAYARNRRHIQRFELVGSNGAQPVPGVDGAETAGTIQLGAGTQYLVYRSRATRIELDAGRFRSYLIHEGLTHVLRHRRAHDQRQEPGRESFSRCAKSLVTSGDPEGGVAYDHVVGLLLELVPEADPREPLEDGLLPVLVLFEGKPLPGVQVAAARKGDTADPLKTRTDTEGRAWLPVDQDGQWLLSCVHMTPARPEVDADWESVWSSLTYERVTQQPAAE